MIEKILSKVQKPARYIGREINAYLKDWTDKKVKFAIGFPDIYEIGMSSLGIRIIYGTLNERDDCICERFFSPWIDMEEFIKRKDIYFFTLEGKKPLILFDIVGFSISSELNYTNLLNILSLSEIPLFSEEREKNHPIIIVGGNASFNPLPLVKYVDGFVVGEGEEIVHKIVDIVKEYRGNRIKILENLNNLESVYIPLLGKKVVKRCFVKDFNNSFFPTRYLIPSTEIIHDRISLEIMRGCGQGCKFCQAGNCWKPVRLRTPDKIVELAIETYKNTGYEEISLLSFSSGDHPQIEEIIEKLVSIFKDKKVSISFPSLRIDTFSFYLALKIKEIKRTNLTFAPESSERLRKEIGKNIKDDELINLAIMAKNNGYKHLKLYFMIGLPQEKKEDLDDIVKLINELSKIISLRISFNTFVPKPHTKFQGERMITKEEYDEKRRFIYERLKGNRFVNIKFHPYEFSFVECLLCRGDIEVGDVVYRVWKKGGKFQNWNEFFNFNIWIESLKESNIDWRRYTDFMASPYCWEFIRI